VARQPSRVALIHWTVVWPTTSDKSNTHGVKSGVGKSPFFISNNTHSCFLLVDCLLGPNYELMKGYIVTVRTALHLASSADCKLFPREYCV